MIMSSKGLLLLKQFEGFKPSVYLDVVGVRTIGYGMTGALIKGLNTITEPQASALLVKALSSYSNSISHNLSANKVALNQNQFDALVCMAYNIGTLGMLNSTLYKNILKGVRDNSTITANFTAWSKGTVGNKMVVLPGLLRRRTLECALFFTPMPKAKIKSGIVTADSLNIRQANNTNSKIIGTLARGSKVIISRIEGDFYVIHYEARGFHGGYVSRKYIKLA